MSRQSLKNVMRLISEANTDLPVEQSFLSDLKRSIEMTEDKNKREPSKTYKPSGMNCIRSMYYQVVGAEQDVEGANYCLVGICNSGTDAHIRIQNAVENMINNDIDCEYIDVAEYITSHNLDYLEIKGQNAGGTETKLYYKLLNMSFMCDGIIRYKGKYYIIEFKTETSYKWVARKGVDEKHYKQATAYSLAFDIPEVLFVYINRDNSDMKAYIFKPTSEQKQDLVSMIQLCDECVAKHTAPNKPENLDKRNCTYCSYKTVCERDS